MPETGDFIRGCSDVWSRLPVSVAGWRYSLAECAATGMSATLSPSYTNIAGTTVTAFSQRVREIFSIRPFMVMPDGNSGGFALPVTFSMPETPVAVEALPENTLLQERLTTLALPIRL